MPLNGTDEEATESVGMAPEDALDLGRALGRIYRGPIAIADDAGGPAHAMKAAVFAGIAASGGTSVDLGTLPMPGLQYFVSSHPLVLAGLMISSSIGIPGTGVCLVLSDGREAFEEDEKALTDYAGRDMQDEPWSQVGETRHSPDAVEDYVDALLSYTDATPIRDAGLTVCVDCADASATRAVLMLLSKLSVRTVALNCDEVAGFRLGNGSDRISVMKAVVPAVGADAGILYDESGQRIIVLDSAGEQVDGDRLAALIIGSHLGSGSEVVALTSTSKVVDDIAESVGAKVVRVNPGRHSVVRRIIEDTAAFGIDDNGFVFPSFQTCLDGCAAMVRILGLIAQRGPLAEQMASIPVYRKVEIVTECPEDSIEDVMSMLRRESSGQEVDEPMDEHRIDYQDGWMLVCSEPSRGLIRIISESSDPEIAERRAVSVRDDIENLIRSPEGSEKK